MGWLFILHDELLCCNLDGRWIPKHLTRTYEEQCLCIVQDSCYKNKRCLWQTLSLQTKHGYIILSMRARNKAYSGSKQISLELKSLEFKCLLLETIDHVMGFVWSYNGAFPNRQENSAMCFLLWPAGHFEASSLVRKFWMPSNRNYLLQSNPMLPEEHWMVSTSWKLRYYNIHHTVLISYLLMFSCLGHLRLYFRGTSSRMMYTFKVWCIIGYRT